MIDRAPVRVKRAFIARSYEGRTGTRRAAASAAQIESHVPPVAKLVMQAEVERLRSLPEQQKWILNACLMRIDRTILPADTLGELILARVEELRVEGKIYRLGAASTAMNSTNGTVPSSFPPHRQTIV